MRDFETKDSGHRISFSSGMVRDTQDGKPRFGLMVPAGISYEDSMLTRFAALLTRGADKYGDSNWMKANSPEELARFRESALRHFMQWVMGERDEDHAAAVWFNIMAYEHISAKIEGLPAKAAEAIEYTPGTVLEDNDGDHWLVNDQLTLDGAGGISAEQGHSLITVARRHGPLKVIEEPRVPAPQVGDKVMDMRTGQMGIVTEVAERGLPVQFRCELTGSMYTSWSEEVVVIR